MLNRKEIINEILDLENEAEKARARIKDIWPAVKADAEWALDELEKLRSAESRTKAALFHRRKQHPEITDQELEEARGERMLAPSEPRARGLAIRPWWIPKNDWDEDED